MPLSNSTTTYGAVTKTFHWLTALLILSLFALGVIGSNLADQINAPDGGATQETIAWATLLFSLHKTVGVAVFFTALARIIWAMGQTKPGLLNGDHWFEARAAETVHWLLYGSLVAVPLSGWVHHAASTGFAPIWWPFGQGLPFIPTSERLSEMSGTLHYILQWVLAGSIALHIAGALKHHVIDGDATLRRMLPGYTPAVPTSEQPGHVLPALAAAAIWTAAIGGAATLGWFDHKTATTNAAALQDVESDWQVQDGSLGIEVTQLGSTVNGTFAEWTAEISYDETAAALGKRGSVTVTVSIASLELGSVTGQAMGGDFFDAATYPTATFSADLIREDGVGLIAVGALQIRDQSVPLRLPFELTITDGEAQARGGASVDRRDFNIGRGVSDEGSLAFGVGITFDLTARREE